jgi:uridylate kinase
MKKLLIKISGELFSSSILAGVITQIKSISAENKVTLVVGGGNFFRGSRDNGQLANCSAHDIGMLSTIVNSIILRDLLTKANVSSIILSAFPVPSVADTITTRSIESALSNNCVIIFAGGAGNPFFTTDTTAVLRGLQIGADEVWKGTKVNGVYSADPVKEKNSVFYPEISHQDILNQKLEIMDQTAIVLARDNMLSIRVFNLFTPNSLLTALKDKKFGSLIRS